MAPAKIQSHQITSYGALTIGHRRPRRFARLQWTRELRKTLLLLGAAFYQSNSTNKRYAFSLKAARRLQVHNGQVYTLAGAMRRSETLHFFKHRERFDECGPQGSVLQGSTQHPHSNAAFGVFQ